MRKFFPILFVLISLNTWTQNHVYFGEKQAALHPSLFFDKDGNLYPERSIPNTELEKYSGSLKDYYEQNPGVFSEIKTAYQVDENLPLEESMLRLNTAIFNGTISDSLENPPTFLIHGFRKSYVPQNQDRTSVSDFDSIIASVPEGKMKNFVLVYWDGMYDCCFGTKFSENKRIFDAFEIAQLNAKAVGQSLGTLILQSPLNELEMMSFSLGAQVINASVSSLLYSKKKIHFYLIEPAISGQDLQNSFTNVDKRNKFSITIVYNENDFVLKKKDPKLGLFGPGPYKHGVTTLGCNYKKDAIFTKQYFDQKKVSCTLVDFSFVGKTHREPTYFNPVYAPIIWGY